MTNGSSDRLDQIAALLQQSIIASDERMTRIEQARERDRQESEASVNEIRQLTQSNAKAIQALTEDLATFRLGVQEDREQAVQERQELRQAMLGIANLVSSLDSDRPTVLRKLTSIETKVDRLLGKERSP